MDTGRWLTIVGLGEDGPEGLTSASRRALEEAEIIVGPPRHLALLGKTVANQVSWPVPFADGKSVLLENRGRKTVALVSGDPSWFGAGSVISGWLEPHEFTVLPGVSSFSLAAARLGWPLQDVRCRAHHATDFQGLWSELGQGRKFIVTAKDGLAVNAFAAWLETHGFGQSRMIVLEALGGPLERVRETTAETLDFDDAAHPVVVAFEVSGTGSVMTRASGKPDEFFTHDGQITKQPVRAMTLAALAPRSGETLWDIGAGSGSVALEWLLSTPDTSAVAVERHEKRAANISANIERLGLGQRACKVLTGDAPDCLHDEPSPDAVFIGGGLNFDMLRWLEATLPTGTRLVTNAVTLETQTLVTEAAARLGGSLLKVDLAEAEPLGSFRSWNAARTIVQWSVIL